MGRGVANEGFLRALLKNDPYDAYHFFLPDQKQIDILKDRLLPEFPDLPFVFDLQHNLPGAVGKNSYHVFHLSDWLSGFVPLCSIRNSFSKAFFPVTGLIHSLSYSRYHSVFLQHLWPGCSTRDGIVVTSQAGKKVMQTAFKMLRDEYHLSESYNAPKLCHIPLGIPSIPAEQEIVQMREAARKKLQLQVDDVMLLYVGRISHYSKMDFLPLLYAISHLPEQNVNLARVHLVLAGWDDQDDSTPAMLARFAKIIGFKFTIVSRPDNNARNSLYAAADIFVSPSDNLQETFGITMLEAGAFGLPVLASDFDGYRDIVVHGHTGFLAETVGPRDTSMTDRLAHLWFDNQYHLQLAQESVVIVPQLSDYMAKLINDPGLRVAMGQAARQRVKDLFVWDKIIPQYTAMWENLSEESMLLASQTQRHPLQLSYAELFAGHFNSVLHDDMMLVWSKRGEALYRGLEAPVIYAGVEHFVSVEHLKKMMFAARKAISAKGLVQALNNLGLKGEQADFLILWALKHDFLRFA